jgi:hypothetical protein
MSSTERFSQEAKDVPHMFYDAMTEVPLVYPVMLS